VLALVKTRNQLNVLKPEVAHDLHRRPLSALSERADRQTRQNTPRDTALLVPPTERRVGGWPESFWTA